MHSRVPVRPHSHRSLSTANAQLSLVEHALCPLDSEVSLKPNFIFETSYFFTDKSRNRKKAAVRIGGLEGLSAHDELYLWGLLSLAISQTEPSAEFMATPYFCLRRLGIIGGSNKGGREFELFRAAIKRLAGIRYQNDYFYDPIRGEHRAVSFGFLSYTLPLGDDSGRAWRFVWDSLFFELARATGGALRFDLGVYRQLSPAARRLYLFLKKLFWRAEETPALNLRHVAVDVLGFAATTETTPLRWKVAHCIEQLRKAEIVLLPAGETDARHLFRKQSKGQYVFQLLRGPRFDTQGNERSAEPTDSPLYEPLKTIGLDDRTIARVISQYSPRMIEQWADITLAARERQGETFFTNSPQAYFIDNLKAAKESRRTPPDWWHELRKQELARQREQVKAKSQIFRSEDDAFEEYLRDEAREAFDGVMSRLIDDLQKSGRSVNECREQAHQFTRTHFLNRFRQEHPEWQSDGPTRLGQSLSRPS
ncbi:MAG: hypothetical protein FJ302_13400 [Planctomycetes bacterium]|nr:hypothetical protein [Planctomycetota bacterium]